MNKKFFVLVGVAVFLFAAVVLLRTQNIGANFLWGLSRGGSWLLPLVIVAALIDSINPCAFSILILTVAFLFSLGKLRSKILVIGLAYIFGIFAAYVLIGLGILQALHIFSIPHFMGKIGASLLIAWGILEILNHLFPRFPIRLKIPAAAHGQMATLMEKASTATAFLLGGLVGACEFPCTGGPYLLVLGLLHDAATRFSGLSYLLLYNLIFVAPLIIILFIASEESLLAKVQAWRKSETGSMRLWGAAAMIILGFLMFAI